MSAHVLQGGPLEGKVIMTKTWDTKFPEALRLLEDPGAPVDAPIVVHVYTLNRGHASADNRPHRPTYHYTHTVTI